MLRAYAHEAVLAMPADGDVRAPGAAITVALCGHWDHRPPCPLAAHHTRAERDRAQVRLRVLFACATEAEAPVRQRIVDALASGELVAPDGAVVPDGTGRWQLIDSRPAEVQAAEAAHAERLVRSTAG